MKIVNWEQEEFSESYYGYDIKNLLKLSHFNNKAKSRVTLASIWGNNALNQTING
jgi:hypothetical protein